MSDTNQLAMARIGTWNTQWANPRGAKGDRVRAALAAPGCDLLCVTEGSAGLLPTEGHVIDGGRGWGLYRAAQRPEESAPLEPGAVG